MARTKVTWDDKALAVKLQNMDRTMQRFVKASMTFHARRAQAYARRNAPWTDRTGNARSTLFARTQFGGRKSAIIVSHGMPYGIFLETKYAGKYSIIDKTISHEGPELMKTLSAGWAAIFG